MDKLLQQTEVIAAIVGAIVGGVIGICGSVITMIISNIQRSQGKLVIISNKTQVNFYKQNGYGGQAQLPDANEMEDMTISINVEFYNSSDIPRTINDFKIELVNIRLKKIFETKEIEFSSGNSMVPYFLVETKTRTVYPKDTEILNCKVYLKPNDVSLFKFIEKVYLIALYPDKKVFKTQIYKKIDLTLPTPILE